MLPKYTMESALEILNKGDKIYYLGLDDKVKFLKVKKEKNGYTFIFGQDFDNENIVVQRWYPNGKTDLIKFLENNIGIKNQ